MAILYAPIILEIPAFSNKIKVWFLHNPAVIDRENLVLLLKDNRGNIIGNTPILANEIDLENQIAIFEIPNNLQDGEFYKCQIAYGTIEEKELNYSSITITRYIKNEPEFKIEGLNSSENNVLNTDTGSYIASYEYNSEIEEALYQYQFSLYDGNNLTLIQTSGWQDYHIDDIMLFVIYEELLPAYPYMLKLEGKTINGLLLTKEYYIIAGNEYDCNFVLNTLKPKDDDYPNGALVDIISDIDAGYLRIDIKNNTQINYKYELLRREVGTRHLELITEFQGNLTWRDHAVEQGVLYEYLVRNVNADKTLISRTLLLGSAKADFDDMFLSDSKRLLKIKFNPQVSSLKNTLLELKIDTIGNQYPFFFRNGNVKYKEIPISGLISYHMDDQEFFLTDEDIDVYQDNSIRMVTAAADPQALAMRSTNLTSENFTAERKFKLEVLDWLTNGKLKLFRSPAEGNYVVRLMNTSLSPNATVGRMLHTFSTTGYECMPIEYTKMIEANVIKAPVSEINDLNTLESISFNGQSTVDNDIIYIGTETDLYYDILLLVDHVEVTQYNEDGSIKSKGTRIILDNDIECYLTSETFTTPSGSFYKNIEVPLLPGNPATLTYRRKGIINNNEVEFPETALNVLVSLTPNKYTEYDYIYGITIIGKENTDCYVKFEFIDGEITTINCLKELTRYYSDFEVKSIEVGAGAYVILYARKKGGEN